MLQRILRQQRILFIFVVYIVVVVMIATRTMAQEESIRTTTNTNDDLERLSDTELQSICTNLGFDILPPEGGELPTHEHYVEAARQCLEIQTEL